MLEVRSATEHLDWIEARAGCVLTRHARAIAAVDSAGTILGMVAFDAWTESSAQMHVAVDRPIAVRALLGAAFHYLFEQAGRAIAIGFVRVGNERALKFDKKVGFREVARIADGWDIGEDLVVLELRKADCRWLKGRDRR